MSAEDLEAFELLILVLHLLLNQLFDELFECRLAGLRDKWFLQENLVDQSVNIGLRGQVQQINGLCLDLATLS